MNTIIAAQRIERYEAPQWLVRPVGDPADAEMVAYLNRLQTFEAWNSGEDWLQIIPDEILGWGEYNAIAQYYTWDGGHEGSYLVRVGGGNNA